MDIFALACAAFLPLGDNGTLLPKPAVVQVRMLFLKPGMPVDEVEKVLGLEGKKGDIGSIDSVTALGATATYRLTNDDPFRSVDDGRLIKRHYTLRVYYRHEDVRLEFGSVTLWRGDALVTGFPAAKADEVKMWMDIAGKSSGFGSPYAPFAGPGFRGGPLPAKPTFPLTPCKD